ncbi:MAG: hypothetical protein RLZZ623_1551 [Actinomycetota bacterium]|jgi:hypothetical protein
MAMIGLTAYVLLRGRAHLARMGAPRVDPFAVGDPWRQHMAATQSAQRRFAKIVASFDEGPLRTSMANIGREVDRAVAECWEIAKRGDQLDDTIRALDGASLQGQFDRSTNASERASLRSQLDSLDRVRDARRQTDERLRSLHVGLGELVSQAAEMQTGTDHTAELGHAVNDVIIQLQALNSAVDEVNNTGRSRGFEEPGPGTAMPAS